MVGGGTLAAVKGIHSVTCTMFEYYETIIQIGLCEDALILTYVTNHSSKKE